MPGGRDIVGSDVHAALRAFGADPAALAAARDAVAPDDCFASYEELALACPPEAIGLPPGLHAAVLAPLFGEFE